MAKSQPKKKTAKRAPKEAVKGAPKKAAKAPTAAKKVARGKRYTQAQKDKVVAFAEKFKADKGRGAVATAVRKFGVTALTISSWIKKGGSSSASSSPAKKRGPRPAGRESVLSELVTLQREISKGKAQLGKLEARFETLKKSL